LPAPLCGRILPGMGFSSSGNCLYIKVNGVHLKLLYTNTGFKRHANSVILNLTCQGSLLRAMAQSRMQESSKEWQQKQWFLK
jgi:hypothetical protein